MKKTKKKATKVKKKIVRLKKKKVKKKKTVVKRHRRKKRKTKKKIFMEDIYSILNKVQIGKKKIIFAATMIDAPTIENNIKDVNLMYKKIEMKTQVVFTVYPNDTKYDDDYVIKLEIMDDEIPDIDQIFG